MVVVASWTVNFILLICIIAHSTVSATHLQANIIPHENNINLNICRNRRAIGYESCSDLTDPLLCSECAGQSNCCSASSTDNGLYGICQDGPETMCPDGGNAICDGTSCPTGISCDYVNCPSGAKYCWGSTVCETGTSCSNFEGLFCHSHELPTTSFKICCSAMLRKEEVSELTAEAHFGSRDGKLKSSTVRDYISLMSNSDSEGRHKTSKSSEASILFP